MDEELVRLHDRVARLERELASARAQADQWREVAEARRVTLERFRQHPAVRVLFRVAGVVLPTVRRARHRLGPVHSVFTRVRQRLAAVRRLPRKLGARRRERTLERDVGRLHAPPADSRRVSVVVLTHDGHENLERLLPALQDRTSHDDVEIIVVDNGSGEATQRYLSALHGVTVVRSEENLSFSSANALGAKQASGEVLCFLNDDVEPVSPGWLQRMLRELEGDVVAVGAQLVYPRLPLLASAAVDVTVQHLGTRFQPRPGGVPHPENIGGGTPDPRRSSMDVPAVTAAALVVDRGVFEDVGGFDTRYEFGAEDVDLCWRLRQRGGRIRVAPDAVLYHHEGATRHRQDPRARAARQERNWDRLASRFGPEIARAVEVDRLNGEEFLSPRSYEIAITVTRDLPEAGYGDWYTAHELGAELERFGWRVRYLEKYRDAWYEVPQSVDTLLVLLDTFDVRRVRRPGLTTIAWVRNWGERWAAHPSFDEYDLVWASSEHLVEELAAGSRQRPILAPLATNPSRWDVEGPIADAGIILPVNHWGADRGIGALLHAVPELQVIGKGWGEVAEVAPAWRGNVPYEEVPHWYASASVVVDQAASHTRDDGSVNARVFDALAAGTMVVTDQVVGARELFGDLLPTYRTPEELRTALDELRDDPDATRSRLEELRRIVLTRHTYAERAGQLRVVLRERANRPSFLLQIGAPDRRVAHTWGDLHLAEALAAELRTRGCRSRIQTRDEWGQRDGRANDVVIHFKGRGRPEPAEGQIHTIWNISHPDELTDEEVAASDLVFVASAPFSDELAGRSDTPVRTLLQATDHHRFRPRPADARFAHDVAFVGNSKHTFRPIVRDALQAGLEPSIYGANWERYVSPQRIVATHVPNEELPVLYSSVSVLLNDHWEDMRRWGFVSNRLFDVLACGGAVVVSDPVAGLEELFGGSVRTYQTPEELTDIVHELLSEPERRRELASAGRARVLAAHTFAHRADRILELLSPLLRERGLDVPPTGVEAP